MRGIMKIKSSTTLILWIIYLFLLAVLLPHTAWAFRAFEPVEAWTIYEDFTSADLVSYVAALAFEAAIAVLTHKLAEHIEHTPKVMKSKKNPDGSTSRITDWWETWKARYLNAFSLGLIIATGVSSLANLAHAVEFASPLEIFTEWGIPSGVYVVAFGGILPVVSLLFARVLSNVNETEIQDDPALSEAKAQITELRRHLKESEGRVRQAEAERQAAEQDRIFAEEKYTAAEELMRLLFATEKRERILAAKRQWPQLTGAAIALMTDSKPSYVSEVLKTEFEETL